MDRARAISICLLLALTAAPALAPAADAGESRIALIIGNAHYKDAPLANPINDARAVAKALNEAGFQVKLHTNLTQAQMRRAIREFGDELHAKQGVGLFYFAGHGVQISNRNFLIPVGADIQREYEVEDQAVDAGSVLAMMESAKARVNIVILDACRNNPFMRNFRSAINGLAPMQAPSGTLVAFSTAPGQTAIDGTGQYGLYTEHLLENLAIPGLKIEDVFKNVRVSVQRASDGRQVPWENTSLTGDFYFRVRITVEVDDSALRQAQQENIDRAVKQALQQREKEEAGRRAAQQSEIEQAVLAALSKRERERDEAQAARAGRDAEAAQASIAKLKMELAELRAAREAPPPPPAARPAASRPAQTAAADPPAQLAVAPPSTPRPRPAARAGGRLERPDVRVGDNWKYLVTDLFTNLKTTVSMVVATVTENHIYTQSEQRTATTLTPGSGASVFDVWNRDWNHLRQGELEYSPAYPLAKFPLDTGSKWSGSVRFSLTEGSAVHEVTAVAAGWERVTVPAGTFDAVRINLRGHLNVSTVAGVGDGTINDTYWYAPAAQQFVRKEIRHSIFVGRGMRSLGILENQERNELWELTEHKLN